MVLAKLPAGLVTANAAYYLGKPQIDTFRFRFFGDYPSAMRSLSAGELDGLLLRDAPTESQLTELGRAKGKIPLIENRTARLPD